MKRLFLYALMLSVLSPGAVAARGNAEKSVFAVVVTRHGVRSISKAPAQYSWADWSPVASSFLTARGYTLMTYLGQYYRVYFASRGIPVNCAANNAYIYADTDQRTLATGSALIEGMCGKATALPLFHNADASGKSDDPLFDATQWAATNNRIDARASRNAVLAALPSPPSAVVTAHRTEFDVLQHLLDPRCAASCTPVAAGDVSITASKDGLAEVGDPLKTASTYAEDLFLEYAQCRPDVSDDISQAMRVHVLAYDINARNAYNPRVRGGTLFAHIVAMLESKAGSPHGDVQIPDIAKDNIVV
ncbi:MAG: hypothetical protein JOZ01_02465, partial [Candidatus Eremiobacteraeota bacterium]|nr:hypothetical protein [Candidatus Eremiobacteraeota bacterium]